MLLKVALQLASPPLKRRVERVCRGLDAEVQNLPGARVDVTTVARSCCDILLVQSDCIRPLAPESIRQLQQLPEVPWVVVFEENPEGAVTGKWIAAGAEAVLSPRLTDEDLTEALRSIFTRRRAFLAAALQQQPVPSLDDFVSVSPAMQSFLDLVRRVVPSDASLLILGETGVGKEHLARAIHAASPRAAGPWVAVNCAALPDTLLESELFGYEEGAFTGAVRTHRGSFELAHRGTLFLDEIGDMPLHLQVKLLRALQERAIRRLGSERTISVDVRVMAATNRDVVADVEAGRFRRDLFFRLGVITLTVPPLRERREDIPLLIQNFMRHLRPRVNRPVTGITPEAVEALQQYDWPGNVRELMNVLERAMLLCPGNEITLHDLPYAIRCRPSQNPTTGTTSPTTTAPGSPAEWIHRTWEEVRRTELDRVERAYFTTLLHVTQGRVSEAARRAGITPRALFDKMRRHGLRKEHFRSPGPGTSRRRSSDSANPAGQAPAPGEPIRPHRP